MHSRDLRIEHGNLTKVEASALKAAFIDKGALHGKRHGLNHQAYKGICNALASYGWISYEEPHPITEKGLERLRAHLETERASENVSRAAMFFGGIALAIFIVLHLIR